MSQVSKSYVRKEVYDKIFEIFITSILHVNNQVDAQKFVSDFFTHTEQTMLAKRLSIAYLLQKGYDYRTIREILKVSTGTIAHVNMSLKHGSDGYKRIIQKIITEESINNLLTQVLEVSTAALSRGTKGSGTWRYLNKSIKQKQKIKETPF